MNPGYLSFILLCIFAILCASGWKDVLMKGISHPAILLFFTGWVASWVWSPHAEGGVRLHGSFVPLLACALWASVRTRGWLERLHGVSVGLLLASFYYVMQVIGKLDPLVLMPNAELETALLIGSVAAAAIKEPLGQIGAICIGTVAGEFMFWYASEEWLPQGLYGKSFQDIWWLTLAANRGCAGVMQMAGATARRLRRRWISDREGGDR